MSVLLGGLAIVVLGGGFIWLCNLQSGLTEHLLDPVRLREHKYKISDLEENIKHINDHLTVLEARLQHFIATSQPKVEPKRTRKKKDTKSEH